MPFGIVPLIEIGRARGVPMPLHEAGVALLGALCGRDFAAENDVFPFQAWRADGRCVARTEAAPSVILR
jgi:hypothetical protein